MDDLDLEVSEPTESARCSARKPQGRCATFCKAAAMTSAMMSCKAVLNPSAADQCNKWYRSYLANMTILRWLRLPAFIHTVVNMDSHSGN